MELKYDLRASSCYQPPSPLHGAAAKDSALREIFTEVDALIGLHDVKNLMYEIHAYSEIQRRRAAAQLKSESTVLHAIFSGNPGSGKTTVARIMARLYHAMGVLSKGHLVEVERADLVGEFIGHTAQRTREHIEKSLGGVMFIDEAYSLIRGGEKDFGREAIDALVKGMEDHRDDFVLILAGYSREMELFLQTNPGLRSRFPLHIVFPDYDTSELMRIAALMFEQRQYYPSCAALRELEQYLRQERAAQPNYSFGNARTVRNLVEGALRAQAVRLMRCEATCLNESLLCAIDAADIRQAAQRLAARSQQQRGEILYFSN